MCRDLKCLPSPGGLMDQDSFFVHCMDLVVAATNAREELERQQAANKSKQRG